MLRKYYTGLWMQNRLQITTCRPIDLPTDDVYKAYSLINMKKNLSFEKHTDINIILRHTYERNID